LCASACWLVLTLAVLTGGAAWLPAMSFLALSLGAWLLPPGELGLWLMASCGVALLCLGFALVITSAWSAVACYLAFFAMLLTTAGWAGPMLGEKLQTTMRSEEHTSELQSPY